MLTPYPTPYGAVIPLPANAIPMRMPKSEYGTAVSVRSRTHGGRT